MTTASTPRLRPMTADEFTDWNARALEHYAQEVAAARGVALAEARRIAEEGQARYLPDGLATEGVRILIAEDDAGERIGLLWLGPNPDGVGPAWIYDIEIVEERRGEGWGRGLMLEAERVAREDGHEEIALNVFGSNHVARRLYESLGYATTSLQMRKSVVGSAD